MHLVSCLLSSYEAKEKYECHLREKAKVDRAFEAKIKHLVADRARLPELLDREISKHMASKNEIQELKSRVGEILIEEARGQESEGCHVFPGNAGSGVERSGYKEICSSCSFIKGMDNSIFNSVTLTYNKDTAGYFSEPLGTTNSDFFVIQGMSQIQPDSKAQIINLLDWQKSTWKAMEETIESLERRLNLLEYDKARLEDMVDRIQNGSQTRHNIESLQTKVQDECSGDILKRYTFIYESPIFEDFKIAQGQHLRSVKNGKYETAKPEDDKDPELLKEDFEKLKSQISVSSEKTCTSGQNLHDKVGTIPGMPKGVYVDKSSLLQHENPTCSSLSNGLASISNCACHLEKLEKNISTGVLDDNATKIDSMSLTEEDAVDKNVILNKTVLAQGEDLDSPANVLHHSFQDILLDFKESEDSQGEILENDASTVEAELQILKKAVRKLAEICQKQEIKLAEFKLGKHIQSLQGRSYLTALHDLFVNLLQDITGQLDDLKKELKTNSLKIHGREKDNVLKQELLRSEAQVAALEKCLEDKNEQIKDLNEKTEVVQSEIDAAVTEQFDLLHRVQGAKKECENQKDWIEELFSINGELLMFSQGKEFELNSRTIEIERARLMIEAKDRESTALMQELTETRKEMDELKDTNDFLKKRYKFLKEKLLESECELSEHGEAIERLTKHLASEIECQDFLLEEDEKIQSSLKEAHGKDQDLEDQLQQSWRIIEKFKEKLSSFESEVSKTWSDIRDIREQNDCIRRAVQDKEHKALTVQKEVGEIQCHVIQLEDELMEKEVQISFLRSSYPHNDKF